MFSSGPPPSLQTELSKLAKLSNVQGGLPPVIRGLPVMAILAGNVVAKATNSQNIIEEQILGGDDAIVLQAPGPQTPTARHIWARPGVEMMCQTCGQDGAKHYRAGLYHSDSTIASLGLTSRRNEMPMLMNPPVPPTLATYYQERMSS